MIVSQAKEGKKSVPGRETFFLQTQSQMGVLYHSPLHAMPRFRVQVRKQRSMVLKRYAGATLCMALKTTLKNLNCIL